MTETRAEQHIEDLHAVYDAIEREDLETFEALLERTVHPDCEFTSQIVGEFEGRTFIGPDGIRRWFTEMTATMEQRYEEREFRPIGENAVLLLTKFSGEGRGSGVAISREIGVIFEYEDGLTRRVVSYPTQAEAVAAAEALGA